MRFLRRRGSEDERAAPADGLEFDIAVPEGLEVRHGLGGNDLVIAAGEPGDPRATSISVGAVRDAGRPVMLGEHVGRVAENAGRDDVTRRLVDEGPATLAGTDAWWTIESAMGSPAQVVERWMLLRDGVGWTVTVQIPWADLHNLRAGARDRRHASVPRRRERRVTGAAAAAAFDPQTGMLTASRETIRARALRAGRRGGGRSGARRRARRRGRGQPARAAPAPGPGALRDAAPDRRRRPRQDRLRDARLDRRGHVHDARDRHGHDDELVSMPADHLVHFLLRLLGVGPRPRVEQPTEIRVDGTALNRAIALRLGDRATGRPRGCSPSRSTPLAGRFRDWWMATSRWPPAPGRPAAFALEVVDTDDGLWSIEHRDDGEAVVRPVTPVATMLALGELLPNQSLVDQDAPRLPVESTPVVGGPVAFIAEASARARPARPPGPPHPSPRHPRPARAPPGRAGTADSGRS